MKIFYSWQSDLNPKLNNYLIRDATKKAIRKLNRDLELEIVLDRDTKNSLGSINIVDEVLRKILESNIFICDVSLINKNWKSKLLKERYYPNPNVLIELGYAVRSLGWKRVICVFNTGKGRVEELPFDIRLNRITTYNLTHKNNIKYEREKLVNIL